MADAHIIPRAFMRRVSPAPFMEGDGLSPSKKRFTGWYDQDILGYDGEKIIARYDDAAAKCFVERRYTYKTRRDTSDPGILRDDFQANQIYEIEGVDTRLIKLFALSLLWRAAVSSLDAMSLVNVRTHRSVSFGTGIRSGRTSSASDADGLGTPDTTRICGVYSTDRRS